MRITAAASRLGTTARMLRYREGLGLLPTTADEAGRHRQYEPGDLAAAAWAAELEQRYDVSPRALAFALRTLADPGVAADVRRLGELTGRLGRPNRALDFDQEKALRLLGRATAPLRHPLASPSPRAPASRNDQGVVAAPRPVRPATTP